MNEGPDTSIPAWHSLTVEETVARLHANPERGLSAKVAAERLREWGHNSLVEGRQRSLTAMFFGQFFDFMILVLLAAAVISGFIGEPMDTIAILVILMLNAVIGAGQEFRAERAVAALRRMAAPQASVLRDGRHQTVD